MADMIPPTLAAFRALMERAHRIAEASKCFDAYTLAALATATPEQLLGIVGEVRLMEFGSPDECIDAGSFVVTPRKGA